jgi:hypothetical protein
MIKNLKLKVMQNTDFVAVAILKEQRLAARRQSLFGLRYD